MSKPENPLLLRQRAASACVKMYAGKRLALGRHDCARLARTCLHHMRVGVPFLKGIKWSGKTAEKTLAGLGFDCLMDAMDGTGLPRIAPARALVGDIIAMPAEDGSPYGCALGVMLSNRQALAFGDGVCRVGKPKEFLAAWSVSNV